MMTKHRGLWSGTWGDMRRTIGPLTVRVLWSRSSRVWTLMVSRGDDTVHTSRHDSSEYAKKRGAELARGLARVG